MQLLCTAALMAMKLEVKGSILNIVSTYAPQVNNSMEEKNDFWEDQDGLIESTRVSQKVMSPVNFNRFNLHIFSRNFKGV